MSNKKPYYHQIKAGDLVVIGIHDKKEAAKVGAVYAMDLRESKFTLYVYNPGRGVEIMYKVPLGTIVLCVEPYANGYINTLWIKVLYQNKLYLLDRIFAKKYDEKPGE